ncbi:MAG: C10 family peptidase [Lentimicrobium sp.]
MKKSIFLPILLLLSISFSLFAGEVNLAEARRTAIHFYLEKYNHYKGPMDLNAVKINDTHTEYIHGLPVYYVFTMSPGGFVIVPAKNTLFPVLGYSLDSEFGFKDQPPNVRYWLNQYAEQVQFARNQCLEPEAKVARLWEKYLINDFVPLRESNEWGEVEPLMTTFWNQAWPYNYYCPEDPAGPGGHAYAGCGATAMGQILFYWGWPDHGSGYHCYMPQLHPEYGEQCADFENTRYRWSEMTDESTVQSVNRAIAELLYHNGVSVDMDYNTVGGSAPVGGYYAPVHMEYFRWDLSYQIIYIDSVDIGYFRETLRTNLDEAKPVVYCGGSEDYSVMHAFVCDGYQDSLYFHFNLGWGDTTNGYYLVNQVEDLTSHQYYYSGLIPDTINNAYPLYQTGSDTLTALSGSIADGSGPIHHYLNNTQASWLIDPQNEQDSVTSITLTFKRFDLFDDDDRLSVYDGPDNTAPLLAQLTGNALPSPITSSGNKVYIEFITGNTDTGPGFYLNYECEQPVWCTGTNQLTATYALFDDGSGRFDYYDSKVCKWVIDPGTSEPLVLHFNYFKTEEDHDFLKIYDSQSQELLADLSGNYENPLEPVTSPSGKMLIFFITNNNTRDDGWEAWYDVYTGIDKGKGNPDLRISPNPFDDLITFSFSLLERQDIRLEVLNGFGQIVTTLCDASFSPGVNEVSWNAGDLQAGIYFYRISAGKQRRFGKLVKL